MLESVWNIPEGEFVSYLCVTGFIYHCRFLWAMWIHTLEFSIVVSLIWLGHVEWFHFLTLCQTILNCFYNICRCWQQFVVTELEFWFTRTGTNSSFAILHHLIHGNRQWFRDGIQTFDYKFISWSEFFLVVSCFLIARLLSAVFVVTDLVTELKMTFTFSYVSYHTYIFTLKKFVDQFYIYQYVGHVLTTVLPWSGYSQSNYMYLVFVLHHLHCFTLDCCCLFLESR